VTVQLLFEPSGRLLNDDNFCLYEKDKLCVVCGAEDSYICKNIVPREYRKYVCTVELFCTFTDAASLCSASNVRCKRGNARARQPHAAVADGLFLAIFGLHNTPLPSP